MNAKQKLFADQYIALDRRKRDAAIAAGYSPHTAHVRASQMLKMDSVNKYIQNELSKIYKRNHASIDEALSILIDIGRTKASDLYHEDGTPKRLDEIPRHAQHAIEEIDTHIVYEWDDMLEVRVPRTRIKKFKASGAKGALVEVLKVMGGYKLDNDQKKPDPIMLSINPLSAVQVNVVDSLE